MQSIHCIIPLKDVVYRLHSHRFYDKSNVLLHNSACFARKHQLVRTFISIDAQARFICHVRSFQL